ILIYLSIVPVGMFKGLDTENYATAFDQMTAHTSLMAGATLICTILIALISVKGLENGIERATKFLMPALFIMLIILATRSLTLPGAMEGFKWYLTVDFSAINGEAILTALGQRFFSIGIPSGGGVIYGRYLRKESNNPEDAFNLVGRE